MSVLVGKINVFAKKYEVPPQRGNDVTADIQECGRQG